MRYLLALIQSIVAQSSANPTTVLFNRLMGSYRIDFDNSVPSCNLTEWKDSTKNVNDFQSACLKYINDESAAYNPFVRPILNASEAIELTFGATVTALDGINEKNQYMDTVLLLRFSWYDQFLTWKPDMNGGITMISIPWNQVWLPDFVTYNDLSPNGMNLDRVNVMVQYDGLMTWLPSAKLKTSCTIDMKNFPFDTQTCFIKMGSWTHPKSQIDIKLKYASTNDSTKGAPNFDTAIYSASTEWELIEAKTSLNTVKYDCCPEAYQDVTYHFTQKRYSYQPVFTLLVPCTVTAFLLLLVFFLPADSGEKVGLNVVILLAMVVFMDQLSAQMPPMPDSVPMIGTFYVAAMIIITASIVSTIICLRLHYKVGNDAQQMPKWVRLVFIDFLPSYIFMGGCCKSQIERESDVESIEKKFEKSQTNPNTELGHIYAELKFIADRLRQEDQGAQCENEWKYVASVFDRLFGIIYFVALFSTFIGTVAMGVS